MIKETMGSTEVAYILINDEYAGWSRAGAFALAEYLEDFSEEIQQDYTLDVVAIRCDFNEFEDIEDYNQQYCDDDNQYESWDELSDAEGVVACLVGDTGAICYNH